MADEEMSDEHDDEGGEGEGGENEEDAEEDEDEEEEDALDPAAKRVRASWETRLGDFLSSADSRPCGFEFSFWRLAVASGALPLLSLRGQPYTLPLEAMKVSALAESVGGVAITPGLISFDASGVSVTGPHWQAFFANAVKYGTAELGLQLSTRVRKAPWTQCYHRDHLCKKL